MRAGTGRSVLESRFGNLRRARPESWRLRCPRCFGKDIVPSQGRGLVDAVMAQLGRVPRHCRFCGKRFYALPAVQMAASAESPTDGSAGPKVR